MPDVSFVKLPSCDCHWTTPMISQHWFRHWLDSVKQQTITWESLGHNEKIKYCKPRVVMMPNLLSLVAPQAVTMTTYEATTNKTGWHHDDSGLQFSVMEVTDDLHEHCSEEKSLNLGEFFMNIIQWTNHNLCSQWFTAIKGTKYKSKQHIHDSIHIIRIHFLAK